MDRIAKELVGIAKELTSNDDASLVYKKRHQEATRLISAIQKKVRDDVNRQKKDPGNWGFAGSLEHVVELLKEIDSFLGS